MQNTQQWISHICFTILIYSIEQRTQTILNNNCQCIIWQYIFVQCLIQSSDVSTLSRINHTVIKIIIWYCLLFLSSLLYFWQHLNCQIEDISWHPALCFKHTHTSPAQRGSSSLLSQNLHAARADCLTTGHQWAVADRQPSKKIWQLGSQWQESPLNQGTLLRGRLASGLPHSQLERRHIRESHHHMNGKLGRTMIGMLQNTIISRKQMLHRTGELRASSDV